MHRFSGAAARIAAAVAVFAGVSCGTHRVANRAEGLHIPNVSRVAAAPGETHLQNIRRLTSGGENAEAYFSPDGRWLIFQSTRDGRTCDQQYVMRTADGSGLRRVSDGAGKTTCGYFIDGGRRILYASTHAADTACPPRPDPSRGYVWRLDPFDLYTADRDGSNRRRLTSYGVYTAEATL